MIRTAEFEVAGLGLRAFDVMDDNRALVTLRPDGRVFFPDDLTLEEAKRALDKCVRELAESRGFVTEG